MNPKRIYSAIYSILEPWGIGHVVQPSDREHFIEVMMRRDPIATEFRFFRHGTGLMEFHRHSWERYYRRWPASRPKPQPYTVKGRDADNLVRWMNDRLAELPYWAPMTFADEVWLAIQGKR